MSLAKQLKPSIKNSKFTYCTTIINSKNHEKTNIGSWTDARAWISYTFNITKPGIFVLQADIASKEESSISLKLGDQPEKIVKLSPTGSYSKFNAIDLTKLNIEEPGTYTLEIRTVSKDWSAVNLRDVLLKPVN